MNAWRIKKVPKAETTAGSISAVRLSTRCMYFIRMNTGMMVAWIGTIIVAKIIQKMMLLPLKRNLAKA